MQFILKRNFSSTNHFNKYILLSKELFSYSPPYWHIKCRSQWVTSSSAPVKGTLRWPSETIALFSNCHSAKPDSSSISCDIGPWKLAIAGYKCACKVCTTRRWFQPSPSLRQASDGNVGSAQCQAASHQIPRHHAYPCVLVSIGKP